MGSQNPKRVPPFIHEMETHVQERSEHQRELSHVVPVVAAVKDLEVVEDLG